MSGCVENYVRTNPPSGIVVGGGWHGRNVGHRCSDKVGRAKKKRSIEKRLEKKKTEREYVNDTAQRKPSVQRQEAI